MKGDSGGPLFVINDCCEYPGITQIGIVSNGPPCATASGAVYTRVDAFRDWIANVTINFNQTSSCCACDGGPNDTGKVVECPAEGHGYTLDDIYTILAAILSMCVLMVVLLFIISICLFVLNCKNSEKGANVQRKNSHEELIEYSQEEIIGLNSGGKN